MVIAIGLGFALKYGGSPKETIIVAQAANGLLLPIIAVFLLYAVNRSTTLGEFRNRWFSNALGAVVVLVSMLIAARTLVSVWNKLVDIFAISG